MSGVSTPCADGQCATSACTTLIGQGEFVDSPEAFDPVGFIERVQDDVGNGARLTRLTAFGVRSDGTVDLTTDSFDPRIVYFLVRPVEADVEAPFGAAGPQHEVVHAVVERAGFKAISRTEASTQGGLTRGYVVMDGAPPLHGEGQPGVPAPTCSFADLWRVALAEGVPSDAVAQIDYDGSYTFRIRGTDTLFELDEDCQPSTS